MNFSLKKLLISGGFVANAFIFLVQCFLIRSGALMMIASLLSLVSLAVSIAIIAGFALDFFENRDIFSFLVLGSLGFSILVSLLGSLLGINSFLPAIISGIISNAYLIFWALKIKNNNIIFSAALVALFVFRLVAGSILGSFPSIIYILIQAANIAAPGVIAFLSGDN